MDCMSPSLEWSTFIPVDSRIDSRDYDLWSKVGRTWDASSGSCGSRRKRDELCNNFLLLLSFWGKGNGHNQCLPKLRTSAGGPYPWFMEKTFPQFGNVWKWKRISSSWGCNRGWNIDFVLIQGSNDTSASLIFYYRLIEESIYSSKCVNTACSTSSHCPHKWPTRSLLGDQRTSLLKAE